MTDFPVTKIFLVQNAQDLARCFPVMKQLRPHLIDQDDFIERAERMAKNCGFQLLALEEAGQIRALAGFRLTESLYYGRFLYVDDLITDEACRSKGYGGQLLDWLLEHAKQHDCEALSLDSGVQRFGAHRFYLSKRLDITCHHFARKLK